MKQKPDGLERKNVTLISIIFFNPEKEKSDLILCSNRNTMG